MRLLPQLLLASLFSSCLPLCGATHSLYKLESSPFAQKIARKVGDLVTVVLEGDSISISGEGSNQIDKDSDISFSLGKFFLPSGKLSNGLFRDLFQNGSPEIDQEEDVSRGGNGTMKNAYAFDKGIMQARVVDQINDSQLVVRGERSVVINGKKKVIYLNGILRKEDIDENNQISSTKMAEVSFEIDGEMVSKDLQPGFFSKIIHALF